MAQVIEAVFDGAVFRPSESSKNLPAIGTYAIIIKRVASKKGGSVNVQRGKRSKISTKKFDLNDLGPITRSALGMVKAPPNKTYRQLLEMALLKKHRLTK